MPHAPAPTRRALLASSAQFAAILAAAGLLPAQASAQVPGYLAAAFDARTIAEATRALAVSAPVESREVSVTAPDIAEDGALVPVGVSTGLPGVRRLLILVEKNPAVLAALFELSDAVEPNLATRIKMAQTSNVYAVAMLADGRNLFARREVRVTLGGCGG